MSNVPHIIRRRRRRRQQPRYSGIAVGLVLVLTATVVGVLLLLGAGIWTGISSYNRVAHYVPQRIEAASPFTSANQPTRMVDRDTQQVLYRFTDADFVAQTWINYVDLPAFVWDAVVSAADPLYGNRPAYNFPGMLADLIDVVVDGRVSTTDPILLQLARDEIVPLHDLALSDPDRGFTDVVLIHELRRLYTREDLLAWALNEAFFGNGAYGIEAASQRYLGKSASALTPSEAALLAGVFVNPSDNPFDNLIAAEANQQAILETMIAYGMVTPEQINDDVIVPISRVLATTDVIAPHYVLAARRQAEQLLNAAGYDGARLVADGGLTITTTLDMDLQYQAECVLRTQVLRLSGVEPQFVYAASDGGVCRAAAYLPEIPQQAVGVNHQLSNGAVVVIAPDTGEVLAYVGSMDYWNDAIVGEVDSAVHSYQPGSMIRPYIYLTGLAQGYTTATMLLDVPQTFAQTSGLMIQAENMQDAYQGPISLREALVTDVIPPAMQVMNLVSISDVLRTAHSIGIETLSDDSTAYDLSLAAYGGEASLLDLTYSMGVLANMGHMVGAPVEQSVLQSGHRTLDPLFVREIKDADGTILWTNEISQRDTLDPALAYLMNNMLGDRELRTQIYGADNPLDVGRPAGVHAGQSTDGRDLWTVGYTPQFTVGIWLGNTTGEPTIQLKAFEGPAAVWQALMRFVNDRNAVPVEDWQAPPTIVEQTVCEVSGLLPTAYCPVMTEVFYQGTQPVRLDDTYVMVEVNRDNGRRATASTPRDLVEERVFFDYPDAALEWAASLGLTGPPTEYDAIGPSPTFGPVAVLSPAPLDYVGGITEIRGNATLPDFQYYQLTYGQGLNPPTWTQIGDRITTPSRGGVLGSWDTSALEEGLYSLRLTVVTDAQEVQESIIQVTVDNTPPSVIVTSPRQGQEVRVSGFNPLLEVVTAFDDNVSVSDIVFYMDGEIVARADASPFVGSFALEALGSHAIWAEAFDAAGNSTISERIEFTVLRSSE